MSLTLLFGQKIQSGSIPAHALSQGVVTSSLQFNSLTLPFTGSFTGSFGGNLSGSLFGTASWAQNVLTASFAQNANPAFPFSGSAVITGSLLISSSAPNPVTITGSTNDFFELEIINASNGNAASADIVASNNATTDFGNYIDMGINSTTYAGSLVGGPSDGYLYFTSSVGELHVGNASTGVTSNVRLFAGGPSSDNTTKIFISGSGNVGIGVTTDLRNTLQIQGTVSASSYTSSINNAVGFLGTASWANNVQSASFATTSSAATSITFVPVTASFATTASAATSITFTVNTGSFTGSFIGTHSGSTFGTASWANNAVSSSFATTASAATSITFTPLTSSFATTASAATSITFVPSTASFATTASFVNSTGLPIGTVSSSGQIDHNSTINYTASRHTDHSAVSISAGTGLTGGGDITTSRTLALTGQALSFHNLASNGLVVRTAADTITARSIVVSGTGLSSSNADGVGGNPTITIGGGVVSASSQFKTLTDSFTGSFTGSHIGSLLGTASWASNAVSASAATSITFIPTSASFATTSSAATSITFIPISASYALTASFASNAGGAGLSGGTANYIPQWTSATAQSSSVLYQLTGNIGVGTLTPNRKLSVNGNANITGSLDVTTAFTAQTKSFKIPHQIFKGKSLVYGVLEGPEHAVYARGRLTNTNIIQLPDEWSWLIDPESITVQLTPIGKHQKLFVKEIVNGVIFIDNDDMFTSNLDCYYLVYATRKDIEPLQTVV